MSVFHFRTAFFIDADFFFRRMRRVVGQLEPPVAVRFLADMCDKHLDVLGRPPSSLYRILVYDCPPLAKRFQYPISKRGLDLSKTDTYLWRTAVHASLRTLRKTALRLGKLSSLSKWRVNTERVLDLVAGRISVADITDNDFTLDIQQKGVDMKIGLDIASIASKHLADQMVLVSGDGDFVPAAKTARREGIDFIVDPMGANIPADLAEHIDGVQSTADYVATQYRSLAITPPKDVAEKTAE